MLFIVVIQLQEHLIPASVYGITSSVSQAANMALLYV